MPQAAPAHGCVTQSAQMCAGGTHMCPRQTASAILLRVSRLLGQLIVVYSLSFASQLVSWRMEGVVYNSVLKASKVLDSLWSLQSSPVLPGGCVGVCTHTHTQSGAQKLSGLLDSLKLLLNFVIFSHFVLKLYEGYFYLVPLPFSFKVILVLSEFLGESIFFCYFLI